jgi:hypothetical protein
MADTPSPRRRQVTTAARRKLGLATACHRALEFLAASRDGCTEAILLAVNNRDKNFTCANMERRLTQIEESITRYLQQLDSADRRSRR